MLNHSGKRMAGVKTAKPMQQSLGKDAGIDGYPSTYSDGSRNGTSQTPHYKSAGNHSARPGSIPAYSGNKSAQKLRG
jgi:hypothetical protein